MYRTPHLRRTRETENKNSTGTVSYRTEEMAPLFTGWFSKLPAYRYCPTSMPTPTDTHTHTRVLESAFGGIYLRLSFLQHPFLRVSSALLLACGTAALVLVSTVKVYRRRSVCMIPLCSAASLKPPAVLLYTAVYLPLANCQPREKRRKY